MCVFHILIDTGDVVDGEGRLNIDPRHLDIGTMLWIALVVVGRIISCNHANYRYTIV